MAVFGRQLRHQHGATLVVVMISLLLITVIGVLALRQGLTRLNISTNSQISTLLSVMNDNVMRQVIDKIKAHPVSQDNPVGYLIADEQQDLSTDGLEVLFCYNRAQTQIYQRSQASTSAPDPKAVLGSLDGDTAVQSEIVGRCNLTTSSNSARNFGVTQVAITRAEPAKDFALFSNDSTQDKRLFRVFVTSIAVAPFAGDLEAIQTNCLNKRLNNDLDPSLRGRAGNLARESLGECLAWYGIPYETKVQEISVSYFKAN